MGQAVFPLPVLQCSSVSLSPADGPQRALLSISREHGASCEHVPNAPPDGHPSNGGEPWFYPYAASSDRSMISSGYFGRCSSNVRLSSIRCIDSVAFTYEAPSGVG
jgi:hypothetical protein